MIKEVEPPQETFEGTCNFCKATYQWDRADCLPQFNEPSIKCPTCGRLISRYNAARGLFGDLFGYGYPQAVPCGTTVNPLRDIEDSGKPPLDNLLANSAYIANRLRQRGLNACGEYQVWWKGGSSP